MSGAIDLGDVGTWARIWVTSSRGPGEELGGPGDAGKERPEEVGANMYFSRFSIVVGNSFRDL